jgi:type I restriction enzyme S subunit
MNNWTEFKISNIIIEQSKSKLQVQNAIDHGSYPFFTSGERVIKHTEYINEGDNIFLATGGVANVKYYSGKCAYSTDTYVLKCKDFDTKYFYYFLLDKRDFINDNLFSGSGLKHLQKKDFYKICFKAPVNTREQKKIAKILSTTDTVIEKTQSAIAKYKAIKQGMLNDLFTRGIDIQTGKLRPKYEDAPELYKESELGWIPNEWDVKELGDVGEIRMCRRIFNHETKERGDIPFYKIGTFGKKPDAYISSELYETYRQIFSFPKKGDILISAAGTIGRTIIYDGSPSYFQDSNIVWIDNVGDLISNQFLYQVYQVVKYKTEGGTIQRLYNKILKSAKFSCPLKSEQLMITERLIGINNKLQSEESYHQKLQQIKSGLLADLLSGNKLVSIPKEMETQTT